MKNFTPITDAVQLDEWSVPEDPWNFAKAIEASQEYGAHKHRIEILFNKGRYFESTPSLLIRDEVAALINVKVEYNMVCASWRKLEEFVMAMNCLDTYVHIKVDWI